jgi:hypothetical protein
MLFLDGTLLDRNSTQRYPSIMSIGHTRRFSPSRAITGATALVASGATGLALWDRGSSWPPSVQSADFFPALLSVCLALVGILLVVQAILPMRGADGPADTTDGSDAQATVPEIRQGDMGPVEAPWRLAGVMLCVLGFHAAIEHFGMVPSSIVVIALLAAILGERRPIVIAIVAVVLPLLVWLLFRNALLVLLPTGQLWDGWF